MFLIPTYLSDSSIHGTGVFTPAPIPAHTRIWVFTEQIDWRLTPEELASFPEPYQKRLRAWCYLNGDGRYVLCGDNARFMNHSNTPNCDDPEGQYTITNRDIEAGEELTSDYRTFDHESATNGLNFETDVATRAVNWTAHDDAPASSQRIT